MKKILSASAALLIAASVSGCGRRNGYEDLVIPEQGKSTLQPVEDIYMENDYTGVPPKKEKVLETISSSDGLCRIDRMESYFDVTLDYTSGDNYAVGAAYAEAVRKVFPGYDEMAEGYVFENIKSVFNDLNGDMTPVENRLKPFYENLDSSYKEELDGFADAIKGDTEGIKKDGILSREEAYLMQFVPDVLRGTACSVLSADGKATATGSRISCRILEWQLGSSNQLCQAHAVVHMLNGDKSFTSVTYLGYMSILTAVNDDGVMLGELDVGSKNMVKYSCEDKKSYTYDMRYALENFTTAEEAVGYLADNSKKYPYCVNVFATDENDSFVAELCVTEEDGETVIRDSSTELNKGLVWDDPLYICAVNSFAAKGNSDLINGYDFNIIRWNRYNELFCGQHDMTIDRFKELMTCEKTDNELARIRSGELVHMVIADYSDYSLQAVLTGTEGVTDTPEFIDLGSWKNTAS